MVKYKNYRFTNNYLLLFQYLFVPETASHVLDEIFRVYLKVQMLECSIALKYWINGITFTGRMIRIASERYSLPFGKRSDYEIISSKECYSKNINGDRQNNRFWNKTELMVLDIYVSILLTFILVFLVLLCLCVYRNAERNPHLGSSLTHV